MNIQALLGLWFTVSLLLCIAGNFVIVRFLGRRGLKTKFVLISTPGYLDILYVKWCKENNKSYAVVVALRILLFLSVVLAAIATGVSRR
jgi:hypothetical protein